MVELQQTLEEAGETFQQKEEALVKLQTERDSAGKLQAEITGKHQKLLSENQTLTDNLSELEHELSVIKQKRSESQEQYNALESENEKLKSELDSLREKLAGRRDSPYLFKGKENCGFGSNSALHRIKAIGPRYASSTSLHSQSSGHGSHTPVISTQGTPYTAMHTKSSLLRLQTTKNSPAKVDKCLDKSCFANNDNGRVTRNTKRKSACGLEADTRATKKRKSATKPKARVSNVFKRVYATRSRSKKP